MTLKAIGAPTPPTAAPCSPPNARLQPQAASRESGRVLEPIGLYV